MLVNDEPKNLMLGSLGSFPTPGLNRLCIPGFYMI